MIKFLSICQPFVFVYADAKVDSHTYHDNQKRSLIVASSLEPHRVWRLIPHIIHILINGAGNPIPLFTFQSSPAHILHWELYDGLYMCAVSRHMYMCMYIYM